MLETCSNVRRMRLYRYRLDMHACHPAVKHDREFEKRFPRPTAKIKLGGLWSIAEGDVPINPLLAKALTSFHNMHEQACERDSLFRLAIPGICCDAVIHPCKGKLHRRGVGSGSSEG